MSSPRHPSGTLSPRDITHQSFDGRVSGYDKGQVRSYLSDVAHRVEAREDLVDAGLVESGVGQRLRDVRSGLR